MLKSMRSWHFRSSCHVALLAVTMLLPLILGMSPLKTYQLWMHSTETQELGTGIASLNFNSPFHSVRETLPSTQSKSRITFHLVPFVPHSATVNNFNWELRTQPSSFPTWLSFSSGTPESSEFALNFDATQLRRVPNPQNPEPFVFQIAGTVYYTHGPERFVEQESRVLNVVVHLNLEKTPAQRSATLGTHFTNTGFDQQTGVSTYKVKSNNQNIPNLITEAFESLEFECGGTEANPEGGCTLGSVSSSPVWIGEDSTLRVKSGVLKVKGSVACWGTVTVDEGAVLIYEGDSSTAIFSITSDDLSPKFENNGLVKIEKGVFRVLGSPVTGKGRFTIAHESKFEFDPRQESNFGSPSSATSGCMSVYNLGDFDILSGRTRFTCAVVTIGLGFLNIGMSAIVSLDGESTHVIGGYHDGTKFVELPGVNSVAAISSGLLTVAKNAKLTVGGGMRFQGLGYLETLDNSNTTVDIEWYDPKTQPDSLIIATGPATERVNVGLLNSGGKVFVKRGGFRLGTGVISSGTIKTDRGTVFDCNTQNAHNEIGGEGLELGGNMTLSNGATVSFRGPLQSTGRLIATDANSHIFFYSPVASTISNPSTGTDLTESFGLFTSGGVHVIDRARLHVVGTKDNGEGAQNKMWPRFYAKSVGNAGGVLLSNNATLEAVSFNQTATAPVVGITTLPVYNPTGVSLTAANNVPFTSYSDDLSKVKFVPGDRYAITSEGVISETPIPSDWKAPEPRIMAGSFGTVQPGGPESQSGATGLSSGASLIFAAICVFLAFVYQF